MKKNIKCVLEASVILVLSVNVPQMVFASDTAPLLPDRYIDTTVPASANVCTITLLAGGNLQAAIDNASLGDTICLARGAMYDGHLTLRNKGSGFDWITIRPADMSFIPPPGVRVNPSLAVNMPKIVDSLLANGTTVDADSGAHHYRFIGIEAASLNASTTIPYYQIFNLASTGELPHDITLDRMYIHGNPNGDLRRGVLDVAISVAVIDSFISEVHEDGSDAQAIGAVNTPGPLKIVNNFLEASGENVIVGGQSTGSPVTPTDIEIRHNYFYKPLSWKGTWDSQALIFRGPWTVKNLLELKNAARVLVDGNVFENNWPAAQTGMSIALNAVDGPTSTIENITITNNLLKNVPGGFEVNANSYQLQERNTNNILIKNNVIEMNGTTETIGSPYQIFLGVVHPVIDHNTVVSSITPYTFLQSDIFDPSDTTNEQVDLTLTNNIGSVGRHFIPYANYTSNNPFAQNSVIAGNVMTGEQNGWALTDLGNYGNGNMLTTDTDSVDYVDFNNGNGGDYHLSASSPYKFQALDGTDPGANIDIFDAAISGVVSGRRSRVGI